MEFNKKRLKEFYENSMVDYEVRVFRDYSHSLRVTHTLNLLNSIFFLSLLMRVTKKFIIVSIPGSPTLFGLIAYRFAYMLFFKKWPGKELFLDKNLKADGHLHHISVQSLTKSLLCNNFVLKKILACSAVASFPWGMGLGSVQWTLLTRIPFFGKFLYRFFRILDLKLDDRSFMFPFGSVYIVLFQYFGA